MHKDGYAERRTEYDERGNVTKISCFGIDGKPRLCKDGYATVCYAYKSDGTVAKVEYTDVSGKAIVLSPVVISAEVVPNLPAAQLGVQKGDIWCRLGSYDILKSESVYDVLAPMQASRNAEKELVVARKSGGGYEIHVFKFPIGLMGIHIEEKNISDLDELGKAYRAYCEKESQRSP